MKKLGFGLMRMPLINPDDDASVDIEQVKEMVDLFMSKGFTYFDTAIMYNGFASQKVAKAAIVDRYPRDSFTLATKLNANANDCKSAEDARRQLATSLERTGAGYFDYYLLHALQRSNYKKYDEYHIWDFLAEQKQKGLVKHWGFSFHADPELLEELPELL